MKKLTARQKGNKIENMVCDMLSGLINGYMCWQPHYASFGKTGKYKSSDILGCFDIIATNKSQLRLIQVKCASSFRSKVEDDIKSVVVPLTPYIKKEYWIYIEDKNVFKIRVYEYTGEILTYTVSATDE